MYLRTLQPGNCEKRPTSITHRLSLAETGLGFRMVVHPDEYNSIKVIIQPQR